ncbi:MAG: formate dehydrogenase accessory sulfurtransferase FdhD [Desulfotalea sp.]
MAINQHPPLTSLQDSVIINKSGRKTVREEVAVETPYAISLNEVLIGSSMVLPIGLEEFGAGFLFGQGYIEKPSDIKEILVCPEGKISVYADVDESVHKEVIISSGCGGTGKISKEMLEGDFAPLSDYNLPFPEIKEFIRSALQFSPLGPLTHCVHGCGLWQDGELKLYYEDVGRHNAVDKILGAILLGKASTAAAVYTTGRLTSDMVLKCARLGIPIIMSRTSPSSLGIAIAKRAGATLVSYSRPERINVFNAPERILT